LGWAVGSGGVGWGPHDPHGALRPRVVAGDLDLPRLALGAASMAEPVADHELDPCRHQRVGRLRGLDVALRPGEEHAADLTGVRLQDATREGTVGGDVTAEP